MDFLGNKAHIGGLTFLPFILGRGSGRDGLLQNGDNGLGFFQVAYTLFFILAICLDYVKSAVES